MRRLLSDSNGDARHAGAAVSAFGLALYARARDTDPDANVVISPASVAIALSMARAGARGRTADEMDQVLHDLGTDGHASWVAVIDAALHAGSVRAPDAGGTSRDTTLRLASTPFIQRGLALEPAYTDVLARRFGARMERVDFAAAAEEARLAINAWVAAETKDRIRELLAEGAVDHLTRLVLANAIYLRAAWQTPFQEGATAPATFTRLDGAAADVPMMRLDASLPYAAGDGWRAVELAYVGGRLAMLVVVPGDLPGFEDSLDEAALGGVAGDLAMHQVALGLPRFGIEARFELGDLLAAMGMPTAFTDAADFTGITAAEPLRIGAVVHQADIDVDEKGTEAAAATAVLAVRSSAPAEKVTLTVDRPFLFALRDLETGAVLFLGRMVDPSVR